MSAHGHTDARAAATSARYETDAAEGSGPTASCGRRLDRRVDVTRVVPQHLPTARSHALPGEGTTGPGSPNGPTAPAAGDSRRGLSREDFVAIAAPILARGGTWREVGDACGLGWRACKGRGENYGLRSTRGAGRPVGIPHTADTRARIAATLRAKHAEGRRR